MALCTQEDVEALLVEVTFTSDPEPVIASLIELVQGDMEGPRGADRKLEAEAEDLTQVFDGGSLSLWTSNAPVNSVASIDEDGTALTEGDDFIVYPEMGRIVRVDSGGYPTRWYPPKPRSITVTYNAGYTTVPADLRKACVEAVGRLFHAGVAAAATLDEEATGIRRIRLEGSDEVEYLDGSLSAPRWAALTDLAVAVAAAYRRPLIA